MQLFSVARKFGACSTSRLLSLDGGVEPRICVHFLSITYAKQWDRLFPSLPIVFSISDFTLAHIGRLTYACTWKGVIGSAMLTAGIAGISQPWKFRGLNFGGSTLGRCMTAPVGTARFPHRDEFYYVAESRRRQFCRLSSSVVQASAEVGQSEENVNSEDSKPSIYDSLETDRITVELFPELHFPLEGNFYPKLVDLVARKINFFLDEVGGEERVPALLQHLGMKLNPHIVAEVMKVQKNPSKAETFFHWAGNQPGFQHNAHTYNLRFWNLINGKNRVPSKNLVLAMMLLEEMVAKGLNPGDIASNMLIDRLCKDNKVGAALKLTRVLERKGFPDAYTYNSLINGLGKVGLFKDIFELFYEMHQKECIPDLITYNSVINWLCKAGLFKEVFELVGVMIRKGCNPDRVTYNSIIHGLFKARRWQEALKIFDELSEKEIVPDVVTYNSLIVGLFKCGKPDEARNVYDLMGLRGCPPDRVTYNIIIDGLLHFRDVDEAWKLFHYMEEKGFIPDEVTYNTLIGGLVGNHRMNDALGVLAAMKTKGCEPNDITYKLLGLSAEKKQHSVGEKNSSNGRGSDSESNGLREPKRMEDGRQVLHN